MRFHPIAVFGSVRKLILPIVLPIVHAVLFNKSDRLYGVWIDLLIFVSAIALALLRLKKSRISLEPDSITVFDGVLFCSRDCFLRDEIDEITVSSGLLYRLIGAVKADIRLCGARKKLVIHRKDAHKLFYPGVMRIYGHLSADAYGLTAFVLTALTFVGEIVGRDIRADLARGLISAFAGVLGLAGLLGIGYIILWYDTSARFSSADTDGRTVWLTWIRLRELRLAELPAKNIHAVTLSQSLFQRLRGSCSMRITTVCSRHIIRGLSFEGAERVLGELGWTKDRSII